MANFPPFTAQEDPAEAEHIAHIIQTVTATSFSRHTHSPDTVVRLVVERSLCAMLALNRHAFASLLQKRTKEVKLESISNALRSVAKHVLFVSGRFNALIGNKSNPDREREKWAELVQAYGEQHAKQLLAYGNRNIMHALQQPVVNNMVQLDYFEKHAKFLIENIPAPAPVTAKATPVGAR